MGCNHGKYRFIGILLLGLTILSVAPAQACTDNFLPPEKINTPSMQEGVYLPSEHPISSDMISAAHRFYAQLTEEFDRFHAADIDPDDPVLILNVSDFLNRNFDNIFNHIGQKAETSLRDLSYFYYVVNKIFPAYVRAQGKLSPALNEILRSFAHRVNGNYTLAAEQKLSRLKLPVRETSLTADPFDKKRRFPEEKLVAVSYVNGHLDPFPGVFETRSLVDAWGRAVDGFRLTLQADQPIAEDVLKGLAQDPDTSALATIITNVQNYLRDNPKIPFINLIYADRDLVVMENFKDYLTDRTLPKDPEIVDYTLFLPTDLFINPSNAAAKFAHDFWWFNEQI